MGQFNSILWNGNGGASADAAVTARTLIYQALRALGVLLRPGHAANNETYADGLVDLNQLVDSWNSERLNIFAQQRDVYDLTGGQSEYVIGDDGVRPVKIEAAALISSGSTVERPVPVFNTGEYHPDPSITIDGQYPVSSLRISPAPSGGEQLAIYSWQPLQSFADLDTPYAFPAGYVLAIRLNLALLMAPAAESIQKIQTSRLSMVQQQAMEAKARIQRLNVPVTSMRCDDALLVNNCAFDVLRGY